MGISGSEAHGGIVPNSRKVEGANSLSGGGALTEDRTIALVNDSATPGASKLYGTNESGVRGWQSAPSGSGMPADTVTAETALGGAASNAGAATTYSRGDHTHGTPADPVPTHNGLATVHASATTIGGKAIPSAGFEPASSAIQTHIGGTGSPHTAAGVGAEASGAVATHTALATGVHGAGASTLATAATLATAISDHAGAADPHTGYQKESEKGAANGYAGLGAGGLVPMAQLATGTPSGTKFVRDDGTLAAASGSAADPLLRTRSLGTLTVNTGEIAVVLAGGVILTGSERITLAGTGRMRVM